MSLNKTIADVVSYQIFAYQEIPKQPPKVDLWNKIGDVNALPLPMACSLTQVNILYKKIWFLSVHVYILYLFLFLSFQMVKNIILLSELLMFTVVLDHLVYH